MSTANGAAAALIKPSDENTGIGIAARAASKVAQIRSAISAAVTSAPPVGETPASAERVVVEDTPPRSSYESLSALVARIQSGQDGGLEELYLLFSRGIRFYLCRQLGPQELEDKVHDTFVVVVQAIQRGELREPERLMGFVRTIVRRLVAAHIDRVVHTRREQVDLEPSMRVADSSENPEETAIFQQRGELIERVLGELSRRDREILTRFYLREQSQDQICTEMGLSDTQFRLLKSRAKARFGELGRKKLAHGTISTIPVRNFSSSSH